MARGMLSRSVFQVSFVLLLRRSASSANGVTLRGGFQRQPSFSCSFSVGKAATLLLVLGLSQMFIDFTGIDKSSLMNSIQPASLKRD